MNVKVHYVHNSLSLRKTTFSTSITNLTAFPPVTSWQLLRKRTYTGTSTMIYANTASCTLPPCDIRLGSLTLPAPKAGRFVELLLLYSQQSTYFFERVITLPGRSGLSVLATTPCHLQLCTVSGISLASFVVPTTAPRIPVFKFPGPMLYQQFADSSRVARSHMASLSRAVALSAG